MTLTFRDAARTLSLIMGFSEAPVQCVSHSRMNCSELSFFRSML